nr:glycosyltransferase family A protein [uncultured Flavobacterium sp.]
MHISVVIPLYNKKNAIRDALDSVFNQTVLPDEVVIVNDGSTDGSDKIVELLNHPLVTLIHQKNKGVSAARNKGIDEAKNEWIAFLDADDVWMPNHLKEITHLVQAFPECSVIATAYELQDSLGNRTPIILNKIPFEGDKGKLTNYFQVASCSHPPLWSSAIVVKKSGLQAVGGFPVGIKSGEDLLTWARLAVKYEIGYSLSVNSVFIQDPAHTYDDKPNRIPEMEDIVGDELIKLYYLNPKVYFLKNYISFWKKMRSSIYLRLGERKKAFTESLKALFFNPFNKVVYVYVVMTILPMKIVHSIFKKYGG